MHSLKHFPRYDGHQPQVPVWRITSPSRPTIHRFYDTSPISPSGRYLGVCEFPFDDRSPSPGEIAHVVVIDLATNEEVFRRATAAWDTQVGAHVQWGCDDSQLFFNDMAPGDWIPFGVMVDIASGRETQLAGPVYMVDTSGRHCLSPDLTNIGRVQIGYGVRIPAESIRRRAPVPQDDGVFITDAETGSTRLLISIAEIYERLQERFAGLDLNSGRFYGFHVKWNPQGDRLMFLLRWLDDAGGKSKNYLLTLRPDGSDLAMAIDARRWRGGHHPNWCPDGQHIVMNLMMDNPRARLRRLDRFAERAARKLGLRHFSNAEHLRLCKFRYDGGDFQVLAPHHFGSGHPTLHENGRQVLTDAYPSERVAWADGTVPLRLIDAQDNTAICAIRIKTEPHHSGSRQEWRVDPHPAWARDGRTIAFNACGEGVRGVYIADLSTLLR